MVVAVRLTKETAEMMRSQKRKQAAALAAAANANVASTSPSPSSVPDTAAMVCVGSDTPPLEPSPGRAATRSSTRQNNEQQQEEEVRVQLIAPTGEPSKGNSGNRSTKNKPTLPTRQQKKRKESQQQAHNNEPPQTPQSPQQTENQTTSLGPVPLPSPVTTPSPPRESHHQHQPQSQSRLSTQQQQAPNPSFAEEDYNMLTSCIANMGSMGSIDSVSELVYGAGANPGSNRKPNTEAAANLLESTARDIMSQGGGVDVHGVGGSNESYVVSSPNSGDHSSHTHSHEHDSHGHDSHEHSSGDGGHTTLGSNEASFATSGAPHSPSSFLLDDALLDPKSSLSRNGFELSSSHSFAITPGNAPPNQHHTLHPYNPSPTSLEWEFNDTPGNMDSFFDDLAHGSSGGSGREAGGSGIRASPKRKSIGSVESDQHAHKRTKSMISTLLYNNDSFGQFANAPLPSFGVVFGSLSNSSTEMMDNPGQQIGSVAAAAAAAAAAATAASSTNKQPFKTVALSPRNRLSAIQPRSSFPPQAPHLSDDENIAMAREHAMITNEYSHVSRGTLSQYDPGLYNALKESTPSNNGLLPMLVSSDRTGSRLAIVNSTQGEITNYKLDECSSYKKYEFYKFLREVYPALEGCTYLLPGLVKRNSGCGRKYLEEEDAISINVSKFGTFKVGHVPGMTRKDMSKLGEKELIIAKQRVECAIYAFGGTVTRSRTKQPTPTPSSKKTGKKKGDKSSIFRTRNKDSSKSPSKSASKKKSKQQLARSNSMARREKYEKKLRQQYFEHGNRLSWDVQANLTLTLNGAKTFDEDDNGTLKKSGSNLSDTPKSRKNRCKKCGQIKQGHICPYVASLQRNIGIMVYPSANAHVANEPGALAPALCEMNNFITFKSGGSAASASFETSDVDMKKQGKGGTSAAGRDEEKTSACELTDEMSSPYRRKTLLGSPSSTNTSKPMEDKRSDVEDGREDNGKDDDSQSDDLLFQPKMVITLDQYRTVSPKKDGSGSKRDYTYPQVPLTFSQRKSMSDALFALSKLVPKLTDECALVLTEARRNDEWDLAVAELMSQVICVLYCSPSKDYALEGLKRYLLTLGIVC